MKICKERVRKTFGDYTKAYNVKDEKIKLKIDHTYRVSELCERIAESLKLTEEDAHLAWLLGMLHDVGRFEQLRRFGTFLDAQSVDHAGLGADILFQEGRIRDYIDDAEEDALLETAVRSHSLYRLPADLDERTLMFCQILRDADKVDILKVVAESPLEEVYNVSSEELRTQEITEDVLKAFYEGHAVSHKLKKTTVDYVVGHLSLVYEIVYPESIKIAMEQNYLKKLLDFPTENVKTKEKFAAIGEKLKEDFDTLQL